jgi:nitrogen fixation/metabolism regulation signal transduction histidine kinase
VTAGAIGVALVEGATVEALVVAMVVLVDVTAAVVAVVVATAMVEVGLEPFSDDDVHEAVASTAHPAATRPRNDGRRRQLVMLAPPNRCSTLLQERAALSCRPGTKPPLYPEVS